MPHDRKMLACHPGEGMTPTGSPIATVRLPWPQDAAIRSTMKATNGIGFTHRPPRWNHQPMGLVKVLSDAATTRIAGQTRRGAASAAPRLTAIRFIPRSLAVGFRGVSL